MSRWLGKVITLGVVYAILVALLEFYFDIDIPTWGGFVGWRIDRLVHELKKEKG